ncbi:hypothetical protein P43SY_004279 [Pythium insidiosum]|uniref:Trehalase n=1 Tax=Pythium insidiosum TaxID=114742 RepID=A0AAD5Q4H3_PYTIN|nr:hypothetical protein P43SY_004279 [Pythium insidiosum]KAJ0395661.1 hypothetical protein ATCC90586_006208 [Pythium insidiosum]
MRLSAILGLVSAGAVFALSGATPDSPTRELSQMQASVEDLQSVFCRGSLLDAVQRFKLFNDSKHFVDMPLKPTSLPKQILNEFEANIAPMLPKDVNATGAGEAKARLLEFLNKHFDDAGSDIREVMPSDYTETMPPRIAGIANPAYQEWAMALHRLWKVLGRSPDRKAHSSYLHPTPLPVFHKDKSDEDTLIVVPGGRFRESYYWDSYWIVEGLLVSGMHKTARRVVQNLLEYVAEYGFVPNGGRIYYLTRSQPPLLSDMVRLVAAQASMPGKQCPDGEWDIPYLEIVVPILEREYEYWMSRHAVKVTVGGETHVLNRYFGDAKSPRPESYREDVHLAEKFFPGNTDRQNQFYNDIIAGAESGWDFSSRWFADQKTLSTIETMDILPVDLNAMLYRMEANLADFKSALGGGADKYRDAAQKRVKAMSAVMWHAQSSSWRDYVVSTASHSPVVSVANYIPLWAGAFDAKDKTRLDAVVASLRASGLLQVAGVQTTTTPGSAEQWDSPNAWPPLQDMVVEGLRRADTEASRSLADELVRTWIKTSFAAWESTHLMFEKYNATIVGGLGAGGEYEPQFGFGWTNGVVLKFLTKFQHLL